MSRENTKISDLCDIIAGQHIAASLYSDVPDGTPYLTGPADFGDREPVVSKWTNSPKVFAKEGDVLVTVKGSGVGKLNLGCDAAIGRQLMALRPKNGKITQSYVFGFLRSVESRVHNMAQGAAIPGITKADIASLELYAPPLAEQKRIAGILDAADALRAKRRESLAQLDTLLQSTFLDMFGDPVTNPKGWETKTLPELIVPGKNSLKRGPFGGALKKEIFVDSGYLVYEQNHALNNDYSFGRYFITEEKYKELIAFKVQPNDILISCSGVYLGKLSIVPSGAKPGIINQALLKVSLDQEKMETVFFTCVFGSAQFKRKHFPSIRGAAIPNLPPMNVMKKIAFITPPLDLQHRFAAIVESVEQQKASQRAHLDELDTLFASLQSRAFNGEL